MLHSRVRILFLTLLVLVMVLLTLGRTTDQVTKAELYVCAWLGSAECQGWLGHRLENQEAFVKAEYWYERAAKRGFGEAQIALGSFYQRGLGDTGVDIDKAFYWYDQAVQGGRRDPVLLLTYGQMLIAGQGTETKKIKGLEWITKAAFVGYPQAQFALVQYYDSTDEAIQKTMPQDRSLALAWLQTVKKTTPEKTPLFKAIQEEEKRMEELLSQEQRENAVIERQLIDQNMLRTKIALPQGSP